MNIMVSMLNCDTYYSLSHKMFWNFRTISYLEETVFGFKEHSRRSWTSLKSNAGVHKKKSSPRKSGCSKCRFGPKGCSGCRKKQNPVEISEAIDLTTWPIEENHTSFLGDMPSASTTCPIEENRTSFLADMRSALEPEEDWENAIRHLNIEDFAWYI